MPLFGEISPANAAMLLNDAGRMVDRWWRNLCDKFSAIDLDAHVVMPDHLHGIVLLQCGAERGGAAVSLSHVVQWFKTMTTCDYFRHVRDGTWPAVNRRLWQRSFFDHIIRSERELLEIREYIETNPGALFERVIKVNSELSRLPAH